MTNPETTDKPDDDMQAALDRGAEPYWMQDIRLAQRKIQQIRDELRQGSGRSTGED